MARFFGPGKEEIWRQLCSEIDAQYVDGGFWKGDKVQASHGEWTVTLDTYTVSTGKSSTTYTRMRAPYVNPLGFRFSISRRSLFTGLARHLGMQDIELGIEPFDHDFVIQGTDESQVRSLLSGLRLRELIVRQPQLSLSVKDDEGWFGPKFPEGVDELYCVMGGVIKDVERLKSLYELFSETLDQLCRIGAADDSDPNVAV